MKISTVYSALLFSLLLLSPIAQARSYLELAPALIAIDTPNASTYPLVVDFRLGHIWHGHQVELALMTHIHDDKTNQLSVEVPVIFSVLYHYVPETESSIKLHLIAGVSSIDVDSTYSGNIQSKDNFYGVSYGLGFEESFKSMPQLKLSLDWIQLYRGDQLNINATSFGIHYEF